MLNLSELKNKRYELIWFDETTIQLKKPTQQMWESIAELRNIKDSDVKGLMSVVYELLYEIFNNNANGRKFSKEEIEENFDLDIAFEFMNEYANYYVPQLGK